MSFDLPDIAFSHFFTKLANRQNSHYSLTNEARNFLFVPFYSFICVARDNVHAYMHTWIRACVRACAITHMYILYLKTCTTLYCHNSIANKARNFWFVTFYSLLCGAHIRHNVHARARVRACVRARVRAFVRARARARTKLQIHIYFLFSKYPNHKNCEISPKPKGSKREGRPIPLLLWSRMNWNNSKGRPKTKSLTITLSKYFK